MAYIDEDFVSAALYHGEPVPGPNTLTEVEWDIHLQRVTNFINNALHSETDVDDKGDLQEISLHLMKQAIAGEPLDLTKTQVLLLKNKYRGIARFSSGDI